MYISDVMIHINENLSSAARTSLEEEMRLIKGVVAPRFSPDKHHLLMIAFNPEQTSSAVLLNKARSRLYRSAGGRISVLLLH